MPSVTEVLDYLTEQELIGWIEKNSKAKRNAIRDEAFRVGKTVDLIIQEDIKDGGYLVPEGDEPVINCLKAWELFKKEHPEFTASVIEMQTELRCDDLVGHPDFVLQRGIIDLKCATSIRPKYWTQTSKYLDMRWGGTPGFIGVLRLDKVSGLYEYRLIEDESFINYEIRVFNAYRTVFDHAMTTREQLRKQLEEELLNVS